MHAFEQGKLLILPNTLLWTGLGALFGVVIVFLLSLLKQEAEQASALPGKDLLLRNKWLNSLVRSRWPQLILTILALALIYVVIMSSLFGTKMSGRNLGVLLMWMVWLFLIIAVLTPLGGRIWCTICPLPIFGDWIQRGSLILPRKGKRKGYNNKFSGLFLKWPARLRNNWLRLIIFLCLATFSTTMVASPRTSGLVILALLLIPTLMSPVFELRAFCRYICPVHAFVGPFSGMSKLALRKRSAETCTACKAHYCEKGSANGWACPYGLNVGTLEASDRCGLCLECLRSCPYDNVSLFWRPFASERKIKDLSDAWLILSIFTIAVIYSILYLGHWPVIRDYVNILDKKNWDLFGIYAGVVWASVLLLVPGLIYLLARLAKGLSRATHRSRDFFLNYSGALLPFGLFLWMAFVIPMLFTNITFLLQSLSDPFGWGWDFFGTANTPWHQLFPRFVPWMQAALLLIGIHLSLRNLTRNLRDEGLDRGQRLLASIPFLGWTIALGTLLLFFFTN